MHVLAIIVALVGIIGAAATYGGFTASIPVLDQVTVPIWLGVAAAGAVLWVIFRRPSD